MYFRSKNRLSRYRNQYCELLANSTFSLWCVPLIKSGSLNWLWSNKVLDQFVTAQEQSPILKIIDQCDVTNKNINGSFEDLDIHYHQHHNSSYRTHCDTVCLDLQNCCYSIYIMFKILLLMIGKFSLWSLHDW
jgi:hypothetical protein